MTFFFDTADHDYISGLIDKIGAVVHPTQILGITTNPNALAKINCDTLSDLEAVIPTLCRLVTEMRNGLVGGTVYVQMPSSIMYEEDMVRWAKYIVEFTDGVTNVGMKIPHFTYALDMAEELADSGVEVNVTGIADWGTLLKALSFPGVTWASLIPGRMEEVGIDANHHMEFINAIPGRIDNNIIAGSMRTVRGLKDAIIRGTVPTIGERVWTEIFLPGENGRPDLTQFASWFAGSAWTEEEAMGAMADTLKSTMGHCPLITEENEKLSEAFFVQMDELGINMYEEFIER